jgi:hypothetical protein
MQAHTVIILTAGLAHKASADALDRAVAELLRRKKSPFLVLGKDGDDVLERCSRLEDCELVFDPNDAASGTGATAATFSGVKAGLHATNVAAFVWRIDRPFPDESVWLRLETALRTDEDKKADVFGLTHDPSELLLVTAQGNKRLKERPAESAWPESQDIVFTRLS